MPSARPSSPSARDTLPRETPPAAPAPPARIRATDTRRRQTPRPAPARPAAPSDRLDMSLLGPKYSGGSARLRGSAPPHQLRNPDRHNAPAAEIPAPDRPESTGTPGRDLILAYQSLTHRRPVPIHVRDIVQRRQMRGRGEIRQRHHIARQPAPMIQQPCHVIQVILDRLRPGLDVARCRDSPGPMIFLLTRS